MLLHGAYEIGIQSLQNEPSFLFSQPIVYPFVTDIAFTQITASTQT